MKRTKSAPAEEKENVRIHEFLDIITPSIIKFETEMVKLFGNTYTETY